MLYELINPSDKYVFEASSHEVAALTVFVFGGAYGAVAKDDDFKVPVFLFYAPSNEAFGAEHWYKENFGRSIEDGANALREEIARTLCTFMLGDFEDYRRYTAALDAITDDAKREAFKKEWQDGRSSINDIGTYAHETGEKILQSLRKETNADERV